MNRTTVSLLPQLLALVVLNLLIPLSHGCGSETEPARMIASLGEDGNQILGEEDNILQAANNRTGSECPTPNWTQTCSCGSNPGRQVCGIGGRWGLCECLSPEAVEATAGAASSNDPAINKGEAEFTWLRTAANSGTGTCRAGHYGGALDGIYNAPSAFNAPVPIVSVDVTGAPGFQIDLAESGNGEFLTVTGGGLNGVALAIFPFKADFADGMLDCTTGILRARIINGSYIVFFDGFYGGSVMYEFEGELTARYDPSTTSFVDGRWAVAEGGVTPPAISPDEAVPALPLGQAGGSGTWNAVFMSN